LGREVLIHFCFELSIEHSHVLGYYDVELVEKGVLLQEISSECEDDVDE
jgi:hypothetical protein